MENPLFLLFMLGFWHLRILFQISRLKNESTFLKIWRSYQNQWSEGMVEIVFWCYKWAQTIEGVKSQFPGINSDNFPTFRIFYFFCFFLNLESFVFGILGPIWEPSFSVYFFSKNRKLLFCFFQDHRESSGQEKCQVRRMHPEQIKYEITFESKGCFPKS